ncbi:group II intron reverse transcriptase domain-containing protein [bacterium]|nr:group II intron reverse transcriptase domain-containing protein [bacterium]
MRRAKNLFDDVCSYENLYAAARLALKGKRGKYPAARFFAESEKEIVRLRAELISETYRHGGYTYFTIYEPKERLVGATPFRDRVVHHAVVRVIEPILEKRFIEDSFACRPGKGTHAAMRRAFEFTRRYRFALKCDIRKYFASIEHDVLMSSIKRIIADTRLLRLIQVILDSHHDSVRQEWDIDGSLFDMRQYPRGLPIGNLTSQILANLHLNALDHFVKHTLRVKGYVRYMDDFILFDNRKAQLKAWGLRIKQKLARMRLEMHPDKYRLMSTSHGVDFVGYVLCSNGRIRVRSSTVKRFIGKYREMMWHFRHKRIHADDVTSRVNSWCAHVAHAQSYGLRRIVLTAH